MVNWWGVLLWLNRIRGRVADLVEEDSLNVCYPINFCLHTNLPSLHGHLSTINDLKLPFHGHLSLPLHLPHGPLLPSMSGLWHRQWPTAALTSHRWTMLPQWCIYTVP